MQLVYRTIIITKRALTFAALVVLLMFLFGLAGFYLSLPNVLVFVLWPAAALGQPLKDAFPLALAAWGLAAFAVAIVVHLAVIRGT